MKSNVVVFFVLGIATCFCVTENVRTPISKLQSIGNMDVLSGKMQIAHYGKEWFRISTVSAAVIGEATFRMSVDFSKAKLNGEELELPKPTVWCQIEEEKTRMYKDFWTTGVITKKDKAEFLNKQYAWISTKALRAVSEESDLMKQAQAQAERIARGYLLAWDSKSNVQKVSFK